MNGSKVTGSMPNQSASIRTITTDTGNQTLGCFKYADNYIQIVPGKGYWGEWSYNISRLQIAQSVLATAVGLTAAKIAKGNTILGIAGTYSGDFKSGRSTTAFSGYMDGGTKTLTAEATSPTARNATVNALTVSHSYYQNHAITVYGYKSSWVQIDKVSKSNGTSNNGSVLTLNKTYSGYTGIRVQIFLDQGGQNWQMDGMGACYFS